MVWDCLLHLLWMSLVDGSRVEPSTVPFLSLMETLNDLVAWERFCSHQIRLWVLFVRFSSLVCFQSSCNLACIIVCCYYILIENVPFHSQKGIEFQRVLHLKCDSITFQRICCVFEQQNHPQRIPSSCHFRFTRCCVWTRNQKRLPQLVFVFSFSFSNSFNVWSKVSISSLRSAW